MGQIADAPLKGFERLRFRMDNTWEQSKKKTIEMVTKLLNTPDMTNIEIVIKADANSGGVLRVEYTIGQLAVPEEEVGE